MEDSDTIPFIMFLNDPPVAIWKAQGISQLVIRREGLYKDVDSGRMQEIL